jgi:hypothetical protein
VRLNGVPVDGPQVITLKTNQSESTASLEGGCFKVPPALLTEKVLDISFTVPGNRVHLTGIAAGFLTGPWAIDLADKKFGSEVSLPKHARVKEACAVVFHLDEPETGLVQTGCRTSLRGTATKVGKSTDIADPKTGNLVASTKPMDHEVWRFGHGEDGLFVFPEVSLRG